VALTASDSEPEVTQHMIYTLASVVRDRVSVREIDEMFVFSGAHTSWRAESEQSSTSSRFNCVCGWMKGIRRSAPEREAEIFRSVVEKVLQKPGLYDEERASLNSILGALNGRAAPIEFCLDGSNFHPTVLDVAGSLFRDGHYRQAVLDAYIALNKAVQAKSGRPDLDGSSLMQHVFSPKNPVLKLSNDQTEQQGVMHLFSGAIQAIRNPNAHNLDENDSQAVEEVLERLAFASLLFRWLDRAVPNT
jgi:uncharacterized protein (TIGR02391 family)